MKSFPFSLLALAITLLGMWLQYEEKLILQPKTYMIIGLFVGILYIIVRRTSYSDRRADRIMILSLSEVFVLMLSSMIYEGWKLTNVVPSDVVLKVSVILFGLLAFYLNFVYIRAEHSYKRKRGNQRLREQPNEKLFSNPFKKKSLYEKDDIVINFGFSAENEDPNDSS